MDFFAGLADQIDQHGLHPGVQVFRVGIGTWCSAEAILNLDESPVDVVPLAGGQDAGGLERSPVGALQAELIRK